MLSPWPRTLESFALHAVARHSIAPTMKSHRICMAETLDRDRQSANNTLGFLMGEQPNDGTTETQTAKRNADGRGHCADGRGELRKPRRDPALGETFLLLQQSRGMRGVTTSKMN